MLTECVCALSLAVLLAISGFARSGRDRSVAIAGLLAGLVFLTTAEILYRLPDHPKLLQSYIWQDYDRAPRFPKLTDFLEFWDEKQTGG